MDEGNQAAVQSHGHKQVREPRRDHTAPLRDSTQHVTLPNPHLPQHPSRRNLSGFSPRQTSSKERAPTAKSDVSKSHLGSSSSAKWTPQRSSDSPARGKTMGKFSPAFQTKGSRGARSAPNNAGKPKPAWENSFEVRENDFPQLAGALPAKEEPPPAQRVRWGPTPHPKVPQAQKAPSSWKSSRRESPTRSQQIATKADPGPCVASPGERVVTSWANIASQPPKKPVPKESPVSSNHVQMEEVASLLEEGNAGKKKRRKRKKKAKGAGESEDADLDEQMIYQEPPKLEDDEEFPGLSPALKVNERFSGSISTAKQCNEENQREGDRPQHVNHTKEKLNAATVQPAETSKKGAKAEKVSGKKSKFPVQLDIGNMLAALEKKQQTQKDKQDVKPVILSVGGGLPVVQKQLSAQKKPLRQQDKIAHNPLDSTSPLVKKGKQREVPKLKKPTALKKVILKEREERKQRRLLEEKGLLPEQEFQPVTDAAEDEQSNVTDGTDDVNTLAEEVDDLSPLNAATHMLKEEKEEQQEEKGEQEEQEDEEDKDGAAEQQSVSPVACPKIHPIIHSRKFRNYCNQMLSKDVDECVTALMKELVRFQDRLYQKDPMKARMKRRIVMGLREVLKHLKLRKIKCVVISPNCERIQSKGGLDEALYTIINTCREQEVPFVFALSRKALGRCVNKVVPVSLVGIFNYDGAQDIYHKMIELSSEARKAYEVMMLNLEQSGSAEAEQEVNAESELQVSSPSEAAETCPEQTQPEEPEYLKIWKEIVSNKSKHAYLNFEEQLSFMHLESERIENTEDEKS